jgi:hypothetical protein
MKTHPLLVVGAIIVSAGAGYYFRSAFPTPFFANDPAAGKAAPEEAVGESARLERTLEAIEAENDIGREIERREEELLARMAADTRLERAGLTNRAPMLVDKVSAEPFYNDLAPHGEWLRTDDYGDVWQPREAQDPNWRPYTNGGWAYPTSG